MSRELWPGHTVLSSMNESPQGHTSTQTAGPLVSVVIPTHNRAEMVARAIRSVQRQTHTNLEIIVVDDASQDETWSTVQKIDDRRIRYIRHDNNRGGSAARNTGINSATGEYIAFLDDDDEWEPEKTQEHLKALTKYDSVLCTASAAGARKLEGKEIVSLDDLRHGRFTAGGTSVLMARAHVLKETRFDENLPRFQDWDLFIRIAQRHTVGFLNKALVRYTEGGHARISNKLRDMSPEQLEAEMSMLRKHREFLGDRLYNWHMCRALLYAIRHRRDRFAHLLYVGTRYGWFNVVRALVRRIWWKVTEGV